MYTTFLCIVPNNLPLRHLFYKIRILDINAVCKYSLLLYTKV